MSAAIEVPINVTGQKETEHLKALADQSAVRWVWQPYIDLSFMGPTGVVVKNSIEPELPDELGNVFLGLRRCQPYPLVNHEYNVLPHEQVGNDLPPSYGNWAPGVPSETQPINAPKYARQCAEELYFKYGAEYGLTVLEPLTGVMDKSVVEIVFQIVQPYAYKLHNLERELTEGVVERMSRLPENVSQIASSLNPWIDGKAEKEKWNKLTPRDRVQYAIEGCRVRMLQGARRAIKTASERYGEFDRDARGYLGSKMGRHTPNDYDKFIADQLGLEVPTVVQQAPVQTENPKYLELLERLTESAVEKNADKDQMAARLAELEEREVKNAEERAALMARLDALVAAKEQDAKVPTKAARN